MRAHDTGSAAIAAYLSSHPPPIHALATRLVALVRKSAQGSSVEFAYGVPFFTVDGRRFAYISCSKTRVLLGFPDGEAIADPTGLLQGTGRSPIRRAEFRPGHSLPRAAIAAWVKAAVAIAAMR